MFQEEMRKIHGRLDVLKTETTRKLSELEVVNSRVIEDTSERLKQEKIRTDSISEKLSYADAKNSSKLEEIAALHKAVKQAEESASSFEALVITLKRDTAALEQDLDNSRKVLANKNIEVDALENNAQILKKKLIESEEVRAEQHEHSLQLAKQLQVKEDELASCKASSRNTKDTSDREIDELKKRVLTLHIVFWSIPIT